MGNVRVARTWHEDENEWRFDLLIDGEPAGFACVIRLDGGAGYLGDLWVHPARRGRGWGRLLLHAVLAALGDRELTLTADPFELSPHHGRARLPAAALIRWYEAAGFVSYGAGRMRRPAGRQPPAASRVPAQR